MGIFDRFIATPATTDAPPAGQQLPPAAPISIPTGTSLPSGTPEPQPTDPAAQNTPLGEFQNLWETDPNKKLETTLNFDVTPEQLQAISAKLDFSSLIPAELLNRIQGGGQDAVVAMQESNNILARAIYEQSAMTTTKLVQHAVDHSTKNIDALIAAKFKTMGLEESIATLNPALSNPAVAPLVKQVQQTIVQKYPHATNAEITQLTNKYFEQVGAVFNPTMANKANTPATPGIPGLGNKDTDWAEFLN